MSNDDSSDRAIGRLEGAQEVFQRSVEQRLEAMEADIKVVRGWIERQRGGKATMTAMLTTAGGIGAAIAEGIHWFLRAGHK